MRRVFLTYLAGLAHLAGIAGLAIASTSNLAAQGLDTTRGDQMIANYFRTETRRISESCLTEFTELTQWENKRGEYQNQLLDMLGLNPLPPKTPLLPQVTSKQPHEEFTVENIHFQSRPGLYVTGNLYLPKNSDKPAPAILYVCGHGGEKIDGVSLGNKTHYQHHGEWFARNGYVCLTIDTLQLGEIEGIHHGTYRYNKWWWLNRGYTPAGVEAWNCVRALDYLESRSEVDGKRMGVTGRSGGGAYSWWIAAIDQRIKCAVPVAGITDLENYVVDGCVEGHCDCMFFFNTYQWDYPMIAALVAPRPLLISNSDRDRIFPLEGVVRTHAKVRDIYRLYEAEENLALQITAGPHKDTQELRVHAFRWFNHFLKGDDSLIETTAVPLIEKTQLRVFKQIPDDQINTAVSESFVPVAKEVAVATESKQWEQQRSQWLTELRDKTFGAWPQETEPLSVKPVIHSTSQGLRLTAFDFQSQADIQLRLYLLQNAEVEKLDQVHLQVMDTTGWSKFLATLRGGFEKQLRSEQAVPADPKRFQELVEFLTSDKDRRESQFALAFIAPRGIGPTAWDQSEKKQTQIRRRFYLLGQSLDGMRIWDTRRAIQVLQQLDETKDLAIQLSGNDATAGIALYASLFEEGVSRLKLTNLPATHRDGPFLLNVDRVVGMPQVLAMAAERTDGLLIGGSPSVWSYAKETASQLNWTTDWELQKE